MSLKSKNKVTLTIRDFENFGNCVDAIGTETFPEFLSQLCADLCSADAVYLCAFFDHQKPAPLYTNHDDVKVQAALNLYNDVAYVLDPFFKRFQEKLGDEVIRLSDFAPDNFKKSEYYQLFYKAMGLRDECGLMIHFSETAALFFSFGVHQKDHRTRPAQLSMALPFIVSLAKRHWTVLTPERTDGTGRLAAHLDAAFNAFGSTILSPREGEIVRMILRGHSSKAIARAFDNSPETIKVHRRRVYTKLQIASQGELLSLFLSALSATPPSSTKDPLVHLSPTPE